MGVFDKLKNVFFEEEYVEVEEPVKKPKKEKKAIAKKVDLPEMPSFNEEKTVREKQLEEEVVERVEKKKDLESRSSQNEETFKFPMDFEEDDFKIDNYPEEFDNKKISSFNDDSINKSNEPHYNNVYNDNSFNNKKEESYTPPGLYEGKDSLKNQKIFRPTPIISPIYGILDKNYKKDEIVQKKEIRLTSASSKKVDVDAVREKAYGDLSNDLVTSDYDDKKSEKEFEKESKDIVSDSLYDLNDSDQPVVSNVTMGDAEEYYNDLGLEYNVDYTENKASPKIGRRSDKKKNDDTSEDSLFDLIDSMYKDSEEE